MNPSTEPIKTLEKSIEQGETIIETMRQDPNAPPSQVQMAETELNAMKLRLQKLETHRNSLLNIIGEERLKKGTGFNIEQYKKNKLNKINKLLKGKNNTGNYKGRVQSAQTKGDIQKILEELYSQIRIETELQAYKTKEKTKIRQILGLKTNSFSEYNNSINSANSKQKIKNIVQGIQSKKEENKETARRANINARNAKHGEELAARNATLAKLQTTSAAAIEKALSNLAAEQAAHQTNSNAAQVAQGKLEAKLAELEENVKDKQAKLSNLQRSKNASNTEKLAAKEALASAQANLNTTRNQVQSQQTLLTKQTANLKSREANIQAHTTRITNLEKKLGELVAQGTKKNANYVAIQRELQTELNKLRNKGKALQSNVEERNAAIASQSVSLGEIQEQLKQKTAEHMAAAQELAKSQQGLAASQQELAQLQASSQEALASGQEISSQQAEQISELKANIAEQEKALTDAQTRSTALNAELLTTSNTLTKTQGNLNRAVANRNATSQTLATHQAAAAQEKQNRIAANLEITRLKGQIGGLAKAFNIQVHYPNTNNVDYVIDLRRILQGIQNEINALKKQYITTYGNDYAIAFREGNSIANLKNTEQKAKNLNDKEIRLAISQAKPKIVKTFKDRM